MCCKDGALWLTVSIGVFYCYLFQPPIPCIVSDIQWICMMFWITFMRSVIHRVDFSFTFWLVWMYHTAAAWYRSAGILSNTTFLSVMFCIELALNCSFSAVNLYLTVIFSQYACTHSSAVQHILWRWSRMPNLLLWPQHCGALCWGQQYVICLSNNHGTASHRIFCQVESHNRIKIIHNLIQLKHM